MLCVCRAPSMMCNAHTGQRHGVKSAHSTPSLLHSHPIPPSPYPHRQHLVWINLGRRGTCINKGPYLLRGKKSLFLGQNFGFLWSWDLRLLTLDVVVEKISQTKMIKIFASVCCLHNPSMQTRAQGRLGALVLGEPSKPLPLYQPYWDARSLLGEMFPWV